MLKHLFRYREVNYKGFPRECQITLGNLIPADTPASCLWRLFPHTPHAYYYWVFQPECLWLELMRTRRWYGFNVAWFQILILSLTSCVAQGTFWSSLGFHFLMYKTVDNNNLPHRVIVMIKWDGRYNAFRMISGT